MLLQYWFLYIVVLYTLSLIFLSAINQLCYFHYVFLLDFCEKDDETLTDALEQFLLHIAKTGDTL